MRRFLVTAFLGLFFIMAALLGATNATSDSFVDEIEAAKVFGGEEICYRSKTISCGPCTGCSTCPGNACYYQPHPTNPTYQCTIQSVINAVMSNYSGVRTASSGRKNVTTQAFLYCVRPQACDHAPCIQIPAGGPYTCQSGPLGAGPPVYPKVPSGGPCGDPDIPL